jgi:hypothetical protein
MAKPKVSIQAPFGLDLKEIEKRGWIWIQTKPSSLAANKLWRVIDYTVMTIMKTRGVTDYY